MELPDSASLSQMLTRVAEHRDKQAFAVLFRYFAPKVKNFGIKQFNDESLAMELVQETLSCVWRKAHLYDASRGAATTWVYTVMRNISFDMLRKIKIGREEHLSDEIWPLISGDEATHEDSDPLAQKQLNRYVERLPEAQRQIVTGMYFNELTQEQLAEQLGVPIGTVKSRLRLALSKLRMYMGGEDD